jgi:3D (Asp-Asp-Asp) domain-containing protein
MLEIILSLIFTIALSHSNIQNASEARESNKTMPFEKKVVQTVKVEKQKEVAKVEPKTISTIAEEYREFEQELTPDDTWDTYVITAYENGVSSTGKRPGDKGYSITRSGKKTVQGVTAAGDLSKLPLGTIVYIETLGYRTIYDSGSKVKNKHIDVFMESYDDCMEFGRQKLKVKIIKMGELD